MDPARTRILQRLRRALKNKEPMPYPEIEEDKELFESAPEELDVLFAQQFSAHGGHFVYCENTATLMTNLKQLCLINQWVKIDCKDARLLHLFEQYGFSCNQVVEEVLQTTVAISSAVKLVARTGSILFNSYQAAGRQLTIAPDVHIVIATRKQLCYDIKTALQEQVNDKEEIPSMLCLTTGASRTADIEKTLVMGAHGPRQLYLFLLEA